MRCTTTALRRRCRRDLVKADRHGHRDRVNALAVSLKSDALKEKITMQLIKQYTFYWSPEGRKLATYTGTLRQCRAQFKREFPQYARFMGEVYRTEAEIN